jgi:hypothetical protein
MLWEVVKNVLASLGGATLLALGVAWFFRTGISHWLSRNIEKHKTDPRLTSENEIERHKAERKDASEHELRDVRSRVKREQLEHEVGFRKVYEKEADIVERTFSLLNKSYQDMAKYLSPVDYAEQPDKQGMAETFAKSFEEFQECFFESRLFLPRPVFEMIVDLRDKMSKAAIEFRVGLMEEKSPHLTEASRSHWLAAHEAFTKEIAPAFERIHAEFQKVPGFPDEL